MRRLNLLLQGDSSWWQWRVVKHCPPHFHHLWPLAALQARWYRLLHSDEHTKWSWPVTTQAGWTHGSRGRAFHSLWRSGNIKCENNCPLGYSLESPDLLLGTSTTDQRYNWTDYKYTFVKYSSWPCSVPCLTGWLSIRPDWKAPISY
jgi:hypothetical protein